jgi:hypothetical protein
VGLKQAGHDESPQVSHSSPTPGGLLCFPPAELFGRRKVGVKLWKKFEIYCSDSHFWINSVPN